MNLESELPSDVLAAIHGNRKIEAIKLLREHRNLGLKEAKNLVEIYVAEHPNLITKRRPNVETGYGRLVVVGLVLTAMYAAYRFYS
jgi:hypothetical protein